MLRGGVEAGDGAAGGNEKNDKVISTEREKIWVMARRLTSC